MPGITGSTKKIADVVAQTLGNELGIAPPPYMGADSKEARGVWAVLGAAKKYLYGMDEHGLMQLVFELKQPRELIAVISVRKLRIRAGVQQAGFVTHLSKSVESVIRLEQPRFAGLAQFKGAPAAEKLNADKKFLKRANVFSRVMTLLGGYITGYRISRERDFLIMPADEGSMLVINSLPRMWKPYLDVKEFIELAGMIEDLL